MAIGPDHKAAFVAFNRFSFGARGGAYAGDLARAASDPRGFLKAELLQPEIAHLETPGLPQTKVALGMLFAFRDQKRMERQRMAEEKRDLIGLEPGTDTIRFAYPWSTQRTGHHVSFGAHRSRRSDLRAGSG